MNRYGAGLLFLWIANVVVLIYVHDLRVMLTSFFLTIALTIALGVMDGRPSPPPVLGISSTPPSKYFSPYSYEERLRKEMEKYAPKTDQKAYERAYSKSKD